jgi:hypothetical protein
MMSTSLLKVSRSVVALALFSGAMAFSACGGADDEDLQTNCESYCDASVKACPESAAAGAICKAGCALFKQAADKSADCTAKANAAFDCGKTAKFDCATGNSSCSDKLNAFSKACPVELGGGSSSSGSM